jgi:lysophospholipase L1-like esterase
MQFVKTLVIGLILGAFGLVVVVFFSPSAQDSLAWRSQKFFGGASPKQLYFEQTQFALWRRGIEHSPEGSVLLLGDSHLHGLTANSVGPNVVNLAIGGLTAQRLEAAIVRRELVLPRAPGTVLLLIGHNDLREGASPEQILLAVGKILSRAPTASRVFLMETIPQTRPIGANAGPEASRALNKALQQKCAELSNCKFLESSFLADSEGFLQPENADADRVHLSPLGYGKLLGAIKGSLR